MTIEAENEWIDRYQIMTVNGRYYTRAMVLRVCALKVGRGHGPLIRALIDDDKFMRKHRCETPSSVASAVFDRLLFDGTFSIAAAL